MSTNFTLQKDKCAFLIIDVQEETFGKMERPCEILYMMQKAIKGMQILQVPIFVVEQISKTNNDATISPIKEMLGPKQTYLRKSAFSCVEDAGVKESILIDSISQWIVIGIEAHVCVLQSVKGLLKNKKDVVVLNDAITSKSIYDFSTAIAELRDVGSRISSTETVLYELMHDNKSDQYDEVVKLLEE